MATDAKAKAAERKKQFLDVWPKLEDELVDLMKKHSMPDDATEWFRRVSLLLPLWSMDLSYGKLIDG